MELQHLDVRLPLAVAGDFDLGEAIPVFHDWVRQQTTEELLIDVADYRHVPGGPGVLLIGHQADYALEGPAGGVGLRYQRKTALPGDNSARLSQALRATLRAAQSLAAEAALQGRLHPALDGMRLVVNDRLLAPNTAQTAAALLSILETWFMGVLGHEEFSLLWDSEPRHRLSVTLRSDRPLDVGALLSRLSGGAG